MISIIAAAAKNGVIGSGGRIPWRIPEDMAYFRETTTGSTVIMGRHTFEEIGDPLPERLNIVVSTSRSFCGQHLMTARSLDHAIELAHAFARSYDEFRDIFLCGGAAIYREGMEIAQRIYLTQLDDEYEGDTYFPRFTDKEFRLVSSRRCESARLSFNVYDRA